jgi:hypothetical protein
MLNSDFLVDLKIFLEGNEQEQVVSKSTVKLITSNEYDSSAGDSESVKKN